MIRPKVWLEPGVAVMNRLRYPVKFLVISALFTIPIAFLMYQWLAQLGSRLDIAERERTGLEYVMSLRRIMEPLERTRGLRLLADGGDETARTRLAEERAKIAQAAGLMDSVNARLGEELQVGNVWLTLRPRVAHPSVEPGLLMAETRRLLEQVADTSNLSLDSDLDSYQLTTAVVTRLPALADYLATMGVGEIAGRLGGLNAIQEAALLAAFTQAQAEREALDRGHAAAFKENPTVRAALEGELRATWDAVDALGELVTARSPGGAPAPALAAPGVYDRYAGAIGAVFRHDAAAASMLDTLLKNRTHALVVKRRLLLSFVVITLLLVAYLWAGFYMSVRRAVRALDRTSQRMLTGHFPGDVVVESRDELRDVVHSFNTVADRLRTEWQRAQDESARARAAEASLAKARDVAEAATRAKSEFLAVMSHEIRTPMNGVLGMAHLLLGTTLDPQQQTYVTTVRDSGQALLTILNDILDFSKMEAGKLELQDEDFDLPSLVGNVTGLLGFRAREKGLDLDSAIAPRVPAALRADPGRLRQVLLNLVGNAIKFTDRGRVQVLVMPQGMVEERVGLRFEVSDTGAGIPMEAQGRLFQEFSQVDQQSTRRAGGTGLGLAISKRIVTAMGGAIGVTSAPGHGSTFWFTVSLAPALGEVKRDAPPAEVSVTPLEILVAEDNLVNQQVARGLLQRRGHHVNIVGNGRAAVEAVKAHHYDVVLMDVHMPEMDGIEATREIRRLPGESGRVPIIALSASAMKDEADLCIEVGMIGHLPKPIDPVALAATLSRFAPPSDAVPSASAPMVAEAVPAAPPPTLMDDTSARDSTVAVDGDVDESYVEMLLDSLGATKMGELVRDLPGHAQPHRERLAQSRASGDAVQMAAAAHALTGMAANLGLTGPAELSAAIEEGCRNGRAREVGSLCEQWSVRFDRSIARLRALCPEAR
jgi:signal transduction histidine kinase/DNA-binding NarL/FixJ family response regulator/HPt (histidine-containing phosphotransfer) domain-containing protein